jgi:hypothetical protein
VTWEKMWYVILDFLRLDGKLLSLFIFYIEFIIDRLLYNKIKKNLL